MSGFTVHRRRCIRTGNYLARDIWLPKIYTYLDVSQPPKQSDVIVVLGGGDGLRWTQLASLYQEGYAPVVLVSGNGDSLDTSIHLITEQGVPGSAMLINNRATSTFDEAQQVLDMLLAMNAKSALIVTDKYHTRRATATYHQVFGNHDVNLTIVAPDDSIDPKLWWQSNRRNLVVTEYIKMAYYWLAYGINSG